MIKGIVQEFDLKKKDSDLSMMNLWILIILCIIQLLQPMVLRP